MAVTSLSRSTKLWLLLIGGTLLALAAQLFVFGRQLSPVIWVLWFVFSVSIGIAFLYWYLQPQPKPTERHNFIDLFIKIASSVLVIAGLGVAWLNFGLEQQKTSQTVELGQTTLENSRVEQRSQRFVKALEALGGANTFQRLAGVYGFKLLDEQFKSKDEVEKECAALEAAGMIPALAAFKLRWQRDKEEHWAIMEILTHYIQETERRPKLQDSDELKMSVEVYEILKYLGKRKLVYDGGEYYKGSVRDSVCLPIDPDDEGKRLNLINADLRNYTFKGGNFQGALFDLADLTDAKFECANLRNANFDGADLTRADLKNADLSYANFRNAHLEGADLTGAILTGVDLTLASTDEKTRCPNGQSPAFDTCPPTNPATTPNCQQLRRGRS
jgi:hypothetical protein